MAEAWLYLMRDRRSGFYKIGFSKHPQFRETTLQAEIPLIELIEAWPGSRSDEVEWHKYFATKRLRGEWFSLDGDDVRNFLDGMSHLPKMSTGRSQADENVEEHDVLVARFQTDHGVEPWGLSSAELTVLNLKSRLMERMRQQIRLRG